MRDINRTVGGCLLRAGLLATVGLVAASAVLRAESSAEQALRGRVEQFYGALQRSDWREAEKYLTKESKPIFRKQPKKPVAGYQIQSIKLEASGERASVVGQVPVFAAFAPRPFLIPTTTQWRLVKGVWYLELPDPRVKQWALRAPPQSSPPPSLHSKDLKFQSTWAGLAPIHKGEVKVVRFAVTNVSQHVVTVSVGQTSCDCLRMKSPQKEFRPGEAGVIEFELDSSSLSFNVEQALTLTVMLASEPEHAYTQLTIATVLTPGPPPPPP